MSKQTKTHGVEKHPEAEGVLEGDGEPARPPKSPPRKPKVPAGKGVPSKLRSRAFVHDEPDETNHL